MLHIKGVCRNCNIYIFISEVKNNICYDIKIIHRHNIENWILMKISLYENVRPYEELARICLSRECTFLPVELRYAGHK